MAFSFVPALTIFLVATVAGFIGSILGLGGGIIIIPVLSSMLGYDIRHVIGASLISVIATSSGAAAAYVRDRLTNLRVAMFLELATTTGAILGAVASRFFPQRVLFLLFGFLLLYSAWGMFQRRHARDDRPRPDDSPLARRLRLEGDFFDEATGQTIHYRARRLVPGFLVMWWAGAVSGVLGIGSGIFKVIGMDLVMGLPIKISSATSNFMMGVTAAAGAGVHFANGDINPMIAGPVALGVVFGAYWGSRLLPRMQSATIRFLFIPILAWMGLQMLWKGFHL